MRTGDSAHSKNQSSLIFRMQPQGETMSRNYGLGSRDMSIAGNFALKNEARKGIISFSTAGTNSERWAIFVKWAKQNNIRKMENITTDLVKEYGRHLAEKVHLTELSEATAQNYVSAVNSVMSIATQSSWKSVSPMRDCSIGKRCAIRLHPPGALNQQLYNQALKEVYEKMGERVAAMVDLCMQLGLRSKEASLINAREVYAESLQCDEVTITSGTKGGRPRKVPISDIQRAALRRAAFAQGQDNSMIPEYRSWRQWRQNELRQAREIVQSTTGGGLRDLRSTYACIRYAALAGFPAPVILGNIIDRDKDLKVREIISRELGHGRIDVINEYIGGRS